MFLNYFLTNRYLQSKNASIASLHDVFGRGLVYYEGSEDSSSSTSDEEDERAVVTKRRHDDAVEVDITSKKSKHAETPGLTTPRRMSSDGD